MVEHYRQRMDQGKAPLGSNDGEISLFDILSFLKTAWKTIGISGLLGIAVSITYLVNAPIHYEAFVQVFMAQVGVSNNRSGYPYIISANIEEPTLLIARLSTPTSYTPKVISDCGLELQDNNDLVNSKLIKLTVPKGVANVVELKTVGPTPQAAKNCAEAVFELIKTTQSQILAPYLDDVKLKMLENDERLNRARDRVANADKSGSGIGVAYLATRDEIAYLLEEIAALKSVVTLSQSRATRVVAPIYVSNIPIEPKKRVVLTVGLLGGLLLGLLIALGQRVIAKIKGKMGEVV